MAHPICLLRRVNRCLTRVSCCLGFQSPVNESAPYTCTLFVLQRNLPLLNSRPSRGWSPLTTSTNALDVCVHANASLSLVKTYLTSVRPAKSRESGLFRSCSTLDICIHGIHVHVYIGIHCTYIRHLLCSGCKLLVFWRETPTHSKISHPWYARPCRLAQRAPCKLGVSYTIVYICTPRFSSKGLATLFLRVASLSPSSLSFRRLFRPSSLSAPASSYTRSSSSTLLQFQGARIF